MVTLLIALYLTGTVLYYGLHLHVLMIVSPEHPKTNRVLALIGGVSFPVSWIPLVDMRRLYGIYWGFRLW